MRSTSRTVTCLGDFLAAIVSSESNQLQAGSHDCKTAARLVLYLGTKVQIRMQHAPSIPLPRLREILHHRSLIRLERLRYVGTAPHSDRQLPSRGAAFAGIPPVYRPRRARLGAGLEPRNVKRR